MIPIILAVVAIVVLFVVVAATRPAAYLVERKREIAAPADVVFGAVNDVERFAGVVVLFGAPLTQEKKLDGASCSWSGDKDIGKGSMKLTEVVANEKVGVELELFEPMHTIANHALSIASAPNGSIVTWSMSGKHNFAGKAAGMLMNMDKALGADLEKGLARLQNLVEQRAPRA
jgi:hypothetical protein